MYARGEARGQLFGSCFCHSERPKGLASRAQRGIRLFSGDTDSSAQGLRMTGYPGAGRTLPAPKRQQPQPLSQPQPQPPPHPLLPQPQPLLHPHPHPQPLPMPPQPRSRTITMMIHQLLLKPLLHILLPPAKDRMRAPGPFPVMSRSVHCMPGQEECAGFADFAPQRQTIRGRFSD